ncbi:tricarballylate utilization 4Fe-4S protein TcuB [Actibacterium sp. MT2.3-13A]|uniref:tricarballylate utilization 4Fe-4S protein TcuB n=1 Tax=Actibacterium sp. MT2.3-13A TaxID=2828332 RepID=UPI001BA5EEF5|nr:tricarballylate utilization 4Fe-4S protein TcuB [Actibacterium sp. MT2.3-13A]
MSLDTIQEARRQVEICNACRYCEGYCAVFPAITRQKAFADADITQLANLCHNCRGCYYACQYTEPHEFALNLPAVLAEVRADSWQDHAWPRGFAGLFQKSGAAIAVALALAVAAILYLAQALRPEEGLGFYAVLSHGAMVAIFAPAFLFPLAAIALSLRGYWRAVGGAPLRAAHLIAALGDAAKLRNLSGGQGQGCNFEQEDRFSDARRRLHQAVLYGFLLCFAATSAGTVMHYALGWEAPYGLFTPPKLLGVPGGMLLAAGALGLAWLKTRADRALGAARLWGGEMAFVLMLALVALTGLALYAATGTVLVPALTALHLGFVLGFFLMTPYSKMVHGFYRLAALARDAQGK